MAIWKHSTRPATMVALMLISTLVALPLAAAERAPAHSRDGITTLVDLWGWIQGWIGKLGADIEPNGELGVELEPGGAELGAGLEPNGDPQELGAGPEPNG